MFKRIAIMAALMLLTAQAVKLVVNKKEVVVHEQDSVEDSPKIKKNVVSKRTPASSAPQVALNEGPSITVRDRDANSFKASEVDENAFGSAEKTETGDVVADTAITDNSPKRAPSSTIATQDKSDASTQDNKDNGPNLLAGAIAVSGAALPTPNFGTNSNTPTSPTTANDSGGSTPSSVFSCSADVGSGTFKDPIQVSLGCSNTASLRYCLSEGACCDPEGASTYTTAIPVGESPKTYCLSFVGQDVNGNYSSVVQKTYAFNPSNPDLMVEHLQKFFQTTELSALMSVASTDFSKNDHYMGVINTFAYDPADAASSLTSCEEIVNNHTSINLMFPTAVSIPETPVASFSATSQIDLFLGKSKIAYGDNWLTTYIKNESFDEAFYSCSTTNVVREDFYYFQSDAAFTTVATTTDTNDIRQFAGSFTSFGHFEPDIINRGPASTGSSSSVMVSNQKLKSGLFGIFY